MLLPLVKIKCKILLIFFTILMTIVENVFSLSLNYTKLDLEKKPPVLRTVSFSLKGTEALDSFSVATCSWYLCG